jgi:putative heme-binding domain-containing protein
LTSAASRDAEALLANIIDPNRFVQPAFSQYLILTDDGRAVSGVIAAETASSVTLTSGKGQSETILRNNIEEMSTSGKSLMPEGFERTISKPDMADLLSFLTSLISERERTDVAKSDLGTRPGLIEPGRPD